MKKTLPIRTQIRLPPELHAELVEEATANDASLNDVMVYHLANRKKSNNSNDNRMLLIDEGNTKSVEMIMEKIVRNAISDLLHQGIEPSVIQDAFTMKE